MSQQIKYFSIYLLVFLSLSCQQTTRPSHGKKPEHTKTIENRRNSFGFYKSFGFCNSEIGYFSQQEADDLYADKIIKIDKRNEIKSDSFSAFDQEKWNCIKENLNLKNDNNIKIITTNANFPFEKLTLIDDKYVVVSRDGYFFTFILKDTIESAEKIHTLGQNFTPLFNMQLTGLSVVNSKEPDVYKKYGLDFSTICNCNSPSIYLNKDAKELIIFNYCDKEIPFKDIKNKYHFEVDKLEVDGDKMVVSSRDLELSFQKVENGKIYHLKVLKGKFPNNYVGNDLKSFYTFQPDKFQKASCEDYDG
ncbi:hypothetical protein FAZ19_17290 [Sphingobacterium alkalisoli]|uniref:Lipoprotein n=1 Tax=Sphingobacterium alkalisoli TaxID=1874115 RepID=A0A4U0GXW2_9SPHI|nr:hypothetical protein [Sphingobacterium alkalisoli]TJY64007.1 hypothetical protein FAZ19_17290 [Sphingobacterium alkalisoli]GGH23492.1 hypothetical protein GCM10011418_30730 [Sphingobacterium alkalisoli]